VYAAVRDGDVRIPRKLLYGTKFTHAREAQKTFPVVDGAVQTTRARLQDQRKRVLADVAGVEDLAGGAAREPGRRLVSGISLLSARP
jgi:hypothetical protein